MARCQLPLPQQVRHNVVTRTRRARPTCRAAPLLQQHFQPTLVSTSSILSSGLHILEYVGSSTLDDTLCDATYLSFSGLPAAVGAQTPAHPSASAAAAAVHKPGASLQQLELLESAAFLPRAGLEALFSKVEFKQESAVVLCERLQQGACRVVWARSTADDLHWPGVPAVVGTAFAVLDGRGGASIWNVCVDPLWQQRGLGRALVRRLVRVLQQQEGVQRVALCSSAETLPFYRALGFRPTPHAPIFI